MEYNISTGSAYTHIINQARNKQRQIIITLLDLKNAFGKVDNRSMVKEYYHLSAEIKSTDKRLL